MAGQEHIGWLRKRLRMSAAVETREPAELLVWLEARRRRSDRPRSEPKA